MRASSEWRETKPARCTPARSGSSNACFSGSAGTVTPWQLAQNRSAWHVEQRSRADAARVPCSRSQSPSWTTWVVGMSALVVEVLVAAVAVARARTRLGARGSSDTPPSAGERDRSCRGCRGGSARTRPCARVTCVLCSNFRFAMSRSHRLAHVLEAVAVAAVVRVVRLLVAAAGTSCSPGCRACRRRRSTSLDAAVALAAVDALVDVRVCGNGFRLRSLDAEHARARAERRDEHREEEQPDARAS